MRAKEKNIKYIDCICNFMMKSIELTEEDKKGFEINKQNANLLLDVLEMVFQFHSRVRKYFI